ncbi:MAG: DUF2189 domain-containing protein [Proteobacteria bacterium]|nr:DUF2189 domain-containing protein [Pseudomonadota bacterium]
MTETVKKVQGSTGAPGSVPAVLLVTPSDILEILAAGVRDFRASLLYGLAIAGIYSVGGWVLILLLVYFDLPYLVYPLAAGFALIAPFIATGFYAVSRSLERNEALSWGNIVTSVWEAARRDLGWMALVAGFSLFIWMDIAALLFFGFVGLKSFSAQELLREIFTTPMGLLFLMIGHGVGAVLAIAVFSISVTSFPMLFDRDIDFVTAMVTSVKVVLTNRTAMLGWCVIIAVLIGLSLLSGLVGLFVILPILGHASWHLYRRAIPAAPD